MSPGDEYKVNEHLNIKAFDSTDLGVSYLVEYDDIKIYHAGDLNFWHWRDESTAQEIDEAEDAFKEAVKPIQKENIDIAFFPIDPRQGKMFDAGANYFIMAVKPRLLFPMHFWKRSEIAIEFARRCRTRETEIIALTQSGSSALISINEDRFMTVNILQEQKGKNPYYRNKDEIKLDHYNQGDPFSDSDLPVSFDGDVE